MINESIHSCKPFFHCFILQFLSKIVLSILWVVCWSTDLCAQFYMVSNPWHEKELLLLQIHTWIIKKLSKIAPSSTAPKAENLPLSIPSKGIVDQVFLINYAGCEEISKSTGCQPYFVCLIVWFTGLSVSLEILLF